MLLVLRRWVFTLSILLFCSALALGEPIPDIPFWQDVAVRIRTAPGLSNAVFRKVCVDKENVVYVLTDRGLARVWEDVLALDRSFRPLAGRIPKDITVSPAGDLFYLFEDGWLSNGQNGRPGGPVKPGAFDRIAVGASNEIWLSGPGTIVRAAGDAGPLPEFLRQARRLDGIPARVNGDLAVLADGALWLGSAGQWRAGGPATAAAWEPSDSGRSLWVGRTDGLELLNSLDASPVDSLRHPLPWPEVTCVAPVPGGVWMGTSRGAVFRNLGGHSRYAIPVAPGIEAPDCRYYAGSRWLPSDNVVSLAVGPDGTVWVLTPQGLGGIAFRQTTLASKADGFHRKIRSRNLRFGLTGERRLFAPGDVVNSEIVDTDNDGGWTSYYIGALAAEFAVTRGERVRREAWESFGALERLQELSTVPGFSARTIERRGFKFSDPDRWRPAEDPGWDWKGHTSSDEICSQTFA
ncbi:MAG: hypothetical protein J0L84_13735, partial [Verrucomicrobia bacterium]|nr:hypothetical protein [Verrucomicrobiota bacterium]